MRRWFRKTPLLKRQGSEFYVSLSMMSIIEECLYRQFSRCSSPPLFSIFPNPLMDEGKSLTCVTRMQSDSMNLYAVSQHLDHFIFERAVKRHFNLPRLLFQVCKPADF